MIYLPAHRELIPSTLEEKTMNTKTDLDKIRTMMATAAPERRCATDLIRVAVCSVFGFVVMPAFATGSNPVVSDVATNTAMGSYALSDNFNGNSGYQNTAAGYAALVENQSGYKNAAFGFETLYHNTSGIFNAGFGSGSLLNANGNYNTAFGADALYTDPDPYGITAIGYKALYANTTNGQNGSGNTAVGFEAAQSNQSGYSNTAIGSNALQANTTGSANTAMGLQALASNVGGSGNTALGVDALILNASGQGNTAVGRDALYDVNGGGENIALGDEAGWNVTSGSYNIEIGNAGAYGDSGAIRIGSIGQQSTAYIQGIYNTPLSGSTVVVTSTGQLGILGSSERFKTDIRPMALDADKIEQLRPVTFHLKNDPNGPLQYGLIAEEVDKVMPDLVIRNSQGRIDGVRYDEIGPLLLKQVQQQKHQLAAQAAQLAEETERVATQNAKVERLELQLTTLQSALQDLKRDQVMTAAR
jgi:hypothetical protein